MGAKIEIEKKSTNNVKRGKELKKNSKLSQGRAIFDLAVITLVTIAAGWIAPRGLNWILTAILMFMFIVVLGLHTTGRALGILINERKLMSLSRFQIVVWTVVILSAYFTIAMERIRYGDINDPLAIEMDWRLWALMGISTTSLITAPMIHSGKKRREPDSKNLEKAKKALGDKIIEKHREGTLYGNAEISDAQITDMFEGDEITNAAFLDMAKIQMFFFTVVAAMGYIVLLFHLIFTKDPSNLTSFPELPEGLVVILGISHAGYLGHKIVDHT